MYLRILSTWLTFLLLLAGCARDRSPGRVNVSYESPSESQAQAALQNAQQFALKAANAGAGFGTFDFGVQDPEIVSDIDCFTVFVDYPDVNSNSTCSFSDTGENVNIDEVFGTFPFGNTGQGSLLPGTNRKFYLAVSKQETGACPTFDSTIDNFENKLSEFLLVGTETLDVTTSTTNISLTGVVGSGQRIQSCTGSDAFNGINFASFDPKSLSGLVAWYDPIDDDTVYTDSSCSIRASASSANSVGCIKDKSGNNNNAIQATATNKPTYTKEGINFRNVLTFDGTQDYLAAGSTVFGTAEGTIVVVASSTSQLISEILGSTDSASTNKIALGYNTSGTTRYIAELNASNFPSGTTQEGTQHVAAAVWSNIGGSGAIYLDDLTSAAFGTTASPAANSNTFFIGNVNVNGSPSTNPFEGKLGEVIIYNRALTTAELTQIQSYIQERWGTP